MRIWGIVFVFLLHRGCIVSAQDLVVKTNGDSINCKINEVSELMISITVTEKGKTRKVFLTRQEILNFQSNFYNSTTKEEPIAKPASSERKKVFIFNAYTGGSYRLASISSSIPASLRSYAEGLKLGYNLGGNATWYWSKSFGLGLKGTYSNYSNQLNNISLIYPNGMVRTGLMKDDISIYFLGPVFNTYFLSNDRKNLFLTGVSIGYIGYENQSILIDSYLIKGSSSGVNYELSYYRNVSEGLFLGFVFSFTGGTLNELEVTSGGIKKVITLSKDQLESLARLDFSVGLTWTKF